MHWCCHLEGWRRPFVTLLHESEEQAWDWGDNEQYSTDSRNWIQILIEMSPELVLRTSSAVRDVGNMPLDIPAQKISQIYHGGHDLTQWSQVCRLWAPKRPTLLLPINACQSLDDWNIDPDFSSTLQVKAPLLSYVMMKGLKLVDGDGSCLAKSASQWRKKEAQQIPRSVGHAFLWASSKEPSHSAVQISQIWEWMLMLMILCNDIAFIAWFWGLLKGRISFSRQVKKYSCSPMGHSRVWGLSVAIHLQFLPQ